MEQVQKALEMAATELNGLYKRLGYKDSSVLSLIYEALDEVKKCNIHDVSGWVSVDDVANPMPNIDGLQIMFESGTYMDYDANPWPHEKVTHWRKKPCR